MCSKNLALSFIIKTNLGLALSKILLDIVLLKDKQRPEKIVYIVFSEAESGCGFFPPPLPGLHPPLHKTKAK